jgi:hypothetical protein
MLCQVSIFPQLPIHSVYLLCRNNLDPFNIFPLPTDTLRAVSRGRRRHGREEGSALLTAQEVCSQAAAVHPGQLLQVWLLQQMWLHSVPPLQGGNPSVSSASRVSASGVVAASYISVPISL